jgi:hypothetical protein
VIVVVGADRETWMCWPAPSPLGEGTVVHPPDPADWFERAGAGATSRASARPARRISGTSRCP